MAERITIILLVQLFNWLKSFTLQLLTLILYTKHKTQILWIAHTVIWCAEVMQGKMPRKVIREAFLIGRGSIFRTTVCLKAEDLNGMNIKSKWSHPSRLVLSANTGQLWKNRWINQACMDTESRGWSWPPLNRADREQGNPAGSCQWPFASASALFTPF